MTHLRLDMYINGHEYLICEAPATEAGFEECLNASDIVTGAIADDLRANGATAMSADMFTEEMIDVLWDITGREVTAKDEITFCMCLWDGDEHIRSMAAINSL
jgi:hypothetical protein